MTFNILGTPRERKSNISRGSDLIDRINRTVYPEEKKPTPDKSNKDKDSTDVLARICEGYVKFMELSSSNRTGVIPTDLTDRLVPTSQQILEFSRELTEYIGLDDFLRYTANYLTALMHSSEETSFKIDLRPLNQKGIFLDFLGYQLSHKDLTIDGKAGGWFGSKAVNSKIRIKESYRYLSEDIVIGTTIYQWHFDNWRQIYPK